MNKLFTFMLWIVVVGIGFSQSELSIEKIMQDPKWIGSSPSNIFWASDSKTIYFDWQSEGDSVKLLYGYNVASGETRKVEKMRAQTLQMRGVSFSKDKKMKLYALGGNLYLENVATKAKTQIISTVERISEVRFSHDELKVYFQQKNNLFAWERSTGYLKQLTNFTDKASSSSRGKGGKSMQNQWLQEDQMALFEALSSERLNHRRGKSAGGEKPISPINIGNKQVWDMSVNPAGTYVLFTLYERADAERTMVPSWITKSGYVADLKARPKVGSEQGKITMGIYSIEKDSVYYVSTQNLPGIDAVPAYMKDYPNTPKSVTRHVAIMGPKWSDNGDALIYMRGSDNKDRWIALLDLEKGEPVVLNHQHDEAWIGGPGIGSYYPSGNMGWMPDQNSIWFQSEADGYSHLYTISVKNKKKKQLTKGKFEVYEPQLSNNGLWWYFMSNEVHPGERHFYKMPVKGGKRTRITTLTGSNTCTLSPNESMVAIRFSLATKPWELYVSDALEAAQPKQVTTSISNEFKAYKWRTPEYITFEARDGAKVQARLYQPTLETKNKAAVIFVHGAGYLQNAHKWWSSYFREYMFHNYLVDNGYTVLDMDYRGSAGYGRDWRTGIYRHMGGKDLTDQTDGAKMLAHKYGIDTERIGIYGGSYGGFISIMAMFKESETFACGAALRAVTDWAHYNHGYTSNILNTPITDSIAYRNSSPIYYAEGLGGPLLMLHGMVDTNVQFQDVVRLSQRLIELGKNDWELAVFPVESHGFKEPASWTDEYKRIFKLMETHLK